jgi:hypothetical protein
MEQGVYFALFAAATIYVITESGVGALWRLPIHKLWLVRGWAPAVPLITLIYCPSCSGFWVGVALYHLGAANWANHSICPWLLSGCAGLLTGFFMATVYEFKAFANEREFIEGVQNQQGDTDDDIAQTRQASQSEDR